MTLTLARPLSPRQTDDRGLHRATAQKRLMIMMLLYGFAVGIVLTKLTFFAVFAGPASATTVAGRAARGDIVDRNGAPLARTIDAWAIGVHPDEILGDKRDIAQRLAGILGLDEARIYGQLTAKNFAYIERDASASLVTEVNAIGEPALVFEREPQRLYPQSELAAPVLGFLDMGGRGASGMERALDRKLTDPATNGQPIALSIDVRAQSALENELGQQVTALNAKGGAGVVLDVRTGEIMALASFPTFNPNNPGMAPKPQVDSSGKTLPGPFYNRVTTAAYELGSTFKPITVAAAIDSGTVTSMAKRFDATVPLAIDRFLIHDDRGDEQKRWLNIPETLIYSSNIATARIADELGGDKLAHMFRLMGFDQPMPFELPARGRTQFPQKFSRITTMTSAYGHGVAVTPLHLAAAYAALVNGGVWHPATLMKVQPGQAAPGRRVISQATSDRMRQLLRLVVLQGTGKKADAAGFRVGGKTGTAEVATGGGYSKKANVSTFAAAFPMDAPRYVVIVMLDSPNGAVNTAAYTAAPVVNRFILRAGPMLGVMPDATRDIDVNDLLPLIWHHPGEKPQTIADPE
ncbi:penicillin-binding protein 2 [Sphingomonas sp.]|jgi:cell division protein FtsI (penicillin-binding protein 3)|uniref:peptidoglycan D,D-transpeptidase FtsI family protein n=1 Tax=Sphingomonas sp. TaxID=28214 RepID=UPI002E31F3D5|nr:penicillin-binding protein 2 [Sphingomonas sp.]HEX4695863.1 penicillin-binding protein 2 [Sphingomonas sp.]